MRLRVHATAALELAEAADHYASEHEGRGIRFLLAYRDVIQAALTFPTAARAIVQSQHYSVRAYPLHRFPYTVFAAVTGEDLVVLAVAHQKRRPGYWADRASDIEP